MILMEGVAPSVVAFGMEKEGGGDGDGCGLPDYTTRKRPTNGAPVLPTNGASLVRH